MTVDLTASSGPLNIPEIKVLRAKFDHETIKEWVAYWESNEISAAMASPDKVESILERIEEDERLILSEFASIGGRGDGENIRKSLTLRGHMDISRSMKTLATMGLLLPLVLEENNISLSQMIHKPTFFHRDFAIAATVLSAVVSDERMGANIETRENLELAQVDDAKQFGFNLFIVHRELQDRALTITKQDLPNRRSIQGLPEKLWVPGCGNLSLRNDTELSEFAFIIAILFGLEAIEIEDGEIRAIGNEISLSKDFVEAYLATGWWSEERRGGQIQNTPTALPGMRRYVRSVFTRIDTENWISVETLVRYCLAIDRAFVEDALKPYDMTMEKFVKKWVRAMQLLGGIEIAFEGTQQFIRATKKQEEVVHKSFVPQPNGEISAFFDPVNVHQVQELLRFADVSDRQEKTIIFSLSPHSMQLGFGSGLNDTEIVKFLSEHAVTPVPETIRFLLSDGYRVHKQHTIYPHGHLIRCRDDDCFDMAIGQLKHENPEAIIVPLSGNTVFISGIEPKGMTRLFSEPLVVQQYSPSICLEFKDTSLVAEYDPFRANIESDHLIRDVSNFEGKRKTELHFDAKKINKKFDGFDAFMDFLEPRSFGGVPAEQRVAFRNALTGGTPAHFREDITVLWIEDEVLSDALYELTSLSKILVRIGPFAFEVDKKHQSIVEGELRRLHIEIEDE